MISSRERVIIIGTALLTIVTVLVIGGGGRGAGSSTALQVPPGSRSAAGYERFPAPVLEYRIPPPSDTPEQQANNKKKVFITGGAGFIGSQLGYHLHNKGYRVILLDNLEFGYRDNIEIDGKKFGTFILGDVLDRRVWDYMANTDVVFHFAALSALPVCQNHPQKATEVNVAGTAAMLEASRLHGVGRFIFASTSAVYEENSARGGASFSENLTVSPHLLYSATKQQSEIIVRGYDTVYDLDTVVLRFFNVYGPHQDFRRKSPPFTSYIVRELANGRTPVLHSNGDQSRDYIFVDDLLRLVVLAMDEPKARGEIFNVASGKSYSVKEMYAVVAKLLNKEKIKPTFHTASDFWKAYPELFQGAKPIRNSVLEKEVNKNVLGDNRKAKDILGWEPQVSMEEGFKAMIKYIRSRQSRNGTSSHVYNTAW